MHSTVNPTRLDGAGAGALTGAAAGSAEAEPEFAAAELGNLDDEDENYDWLQDDSILDEVLGIEQLTQLVGCQSVRLGDLRDRTQPELRHRASTAHVDVQRLAGVPFVGSGVLGSAVCMDKDVMKRLLREAGRLFFMVRVSPDGPERP